MPIPVYRTGRGAITITPSPTGISREGSLVMWNLCVVSILGDMAGRLDPQQHRLAIEIVGPWSVAKIYSAGPDPTIFLSDEAHKLKKIFEDVWQTATLVRIIRTILPHQAENRQRDERVIADVRDFCDERIAWISENALVGDIACERVMFEELAQVIAQLLRVALGDTHIAHFITEYDKAMAGLREADALGRASVN